MPSTDITKCVTNTCPKRNQCLRYTMPSGHHQLCADFTPSDGECKLFIENK